MIMSGICVKINVSGGKGGGRDGTRLREADGRDIPDCDSSQLCICLKFPVTVFK